jgi:Icc-related predicted phosphoesterase
MKIVCLSDTHNNHGEIDFLPEGDVLIHTGDFTNTGKYNEVLSFVDWFCKLNFRYKILVAGNHEITLDEPFYETHWKKFHKKKQNPKKIKELITSSDIIYLENTSVTIEGIKFYGSPYTLAGNVLWAFPILGDGDAVNKWDYIPQDTDILLTHSPPEGYLDHYNGKHYGCDILLAYVIDKIKPKFHIFGHIHNQNGCIETENTIFVNAGIVDGDHKVINEPFLFELS